MKLLKRFNGMSFTHRELGGGNGRSSVCRCGAVYDCSRRGARPVRHSRWPAYSWGCCSKTPQIETEEKGVFDAAPTDLSGKTV
jgi:hypothetical protein